jgi:transcriptional regulator of heat shock response
MLNERQQKILFSVVEEYVKTAQPVASKAIADHDDFGVSPATVRNDMAALEAAGLLRQPHTSSGRVPTEEGYRVYLQLARQRPKRRLPQVDRRSLSEAQDRKDPHVLMREIARVLVELSGETALASLDSDWHHYTGISKLFEKPDFNDVATLRKISTVIDQFDEVMNGAFGGTEKDMNVWIGRENPFNKQMTTITVKYRLPNGMVGVLGLVGPLRMNYRRNMRLLNEAKRLLEDEL